MSKLPVALLAARLLSVVEAHDGKPVVVVVNSEHKAEGLASLVGALLPRRPSHFFPAWDCLPYDRASPSANVMGQRLRVLNDIGRSPDGTVLFTTPEAILQRVPAPAMLVHDVVVKVGQTLDLPAVTGTLSRLGYDHRGEVEDPGQFAVRGEVVDVFPAGLRPGRITVIDGRVQSIHRFDPLSQRSIKRELNRIRIGPVSEILRPGDSEPPQHFPGMEHWLPDFVPDLDILVDHLPEAVITIEPKAEARIGSVLAQIEEAFQERSALETRNKTPHRKALRPERLYVTPEQWRDAATSRTAPFPEADDYSSVPRFHAEPDRNQAFARFLEKRRMGGDRLVLASSQEKVLAMLAKQAVRCTGHAPTRVEAWSTVREAEPGSVMVMQLPADQGFADDGDGITLITGSDLLGTRAHNVSHSSHLAWHTAHNALVPGDVVIHLDHGVGKLRGLEKVETGAVSAQETLRLDFAKETNLLAPVEAMDAIWRYSSSVEGITLDKLDTDGWRTRSVKIMGEIAQTARALVQLAAERNAREAAKIVPPAAEFERFTDLFPYAPTPDQAHAIDEVLHDLASGRPMDRLVVGDVGFGKTEIAMRAAASAVLAGQQVAVVAPTTVLVRQHVETFKRRFEALGIEVAHLSRLTPANEAKRVKDGLADGSIRLVIGTHALTGHGVAFSKLGLLIIDEEQRFGLADKEKLREIGTGIHVLTLTATPIPRTLQSALVGLQDLSILSTPPARRRPIRTMVAPFDKTALHNALLHEKARGGQSFVVVPRIEDLEPLAAELVATAPDLTILVAHGRMPPAEVDAVMVAFAEGHGDVLIATSLIESGLDVPRANTMVVVDAERFGLGQLHQLRGRVGRGRQQGICHLMTGPQDAMAEATLQRLNTLTTLDRLGSGMAISARDLDLRGAGDLMGDDQAGHLRLIGLGLYQHLLQLAIREARGEVVEDWTPEIHIDGVAASLPPDYIPEAEIRLNIYARLARVTDVHDVEALAEELDDRFGPAPDAVVALLDLARLRSLCRSHRVARVDAGPRGLAFTVRHGTDPAHLLHHAPAKDRQAFTVKNRRLIYAVTDDAPETRLQLATHILEQLH